MCVQASCVFELFGRQLHGHLQAERDEATKRQEQLLQFFAQQIAAERELMHQMLAQGKADSAANREQIERICTRSEEDSAAKREQIDRICTKSEEDSAANRAQISQIIKDTSEERLVRDWCYAQHSDTDSGCLSEDGQDVVGSPAGCGRGANSAT